MKYFTISELSHSETAEKTNIKNQPDAISVINLKTLVNKVLDPARKMLGEPIVVNSGYRSRKVNELVKGAVGSQHCIGCAADITCRSVSTLYTIIADNLIFDQLIWYRSKNFIHVSYVSFRKNREQIIIKP